MDTNLDHMDGLWQFKEMQEDKEAHGVLNDHFTFLLEKEHITVRIPSFQPASWQSADSFYKLSCRWQGDDLEYLSPINNTWFHLATKMDDSFVVLGEGQKKVFEKIEEGQVAQWNKAILKKDRLKFDYESIGNK